MTDDLPYGTQPLMRPATRPSHPAAADDLMTRRAWMAAAAVTTAGAIALGGSRLVRRDHLFSSHPAAAREARPPARPTHPAAVVTDGGAAQPNLIRAENAKPGTSHFAIRMEEPYWDMLHAWCDHDSARVGDQVTVYATTKAATFRAEAFRLGWYGGAGARKVWESNAPIDGFDQPPASIDPDTNMRSCSHWRPSFSVRVGRDWTPGMFVFRLTGADGGNTFVPLTVLSDRRAELLMVSAITTWNAYNQYGGASLYTGEEGRSRVVTFDRPYDLSGSGHLFGGEYEMVQLVESEGVDVAYTTSIDLHARPGQIRRNGYKAVVSLNHDEYYSLPMRQAMEGARDVGVNLVFIGSNTCYRRIRLDPSPIGPHRLEVNYRVASEDPLYHDGDQRLVTTEWRDAPAADPEAGLTGVYYESNPCLADMVVADADAWMFAGTGLSNGDRFADLVQNEYDRVYPEMSGTPHDIQVLCHSPLVCRGRSSYADAAYYTVPSGAGVFATGTLWWERQLGPRCLETTGTHTDLCHLRQITWNVLEAFLRGPAAHAHPAVRNLETLGIRPGYTGPPPGSGGETSSEVSATRAAHPHPEGDSDTGSTTTEPPTTTTTSEPSPSTTTSTLPTSSTTP
ncbi:MAG TPA: N,N-dimethylformamidase beta subunit family domain-containing protein [Acidimicrobiales bacterium]|nr:N,N-dimethylformamidase beta subunit family domain-containing protein [Acidimicrobiales bacterium]